MPTPPPGSRHAAAAATIVQDHASLAIIASLVPIPFFEFAAVSAVHLKMIEKLTREYGLEFRPQLARGIITALLAGSVSSYLDSLVTGTIAKLFPGIGSAVALVTVPSIAGGVTYAVGRVFIRHFEAGGSLLDFDFGRARPGLLQEIERNRVNPAELAQVIGSSAASNSSR